MGVKGIVPEEETLLPLGQAEIKKSGTDITVLAVGPCVPEAVKVSERMGIEGMSIEVLDPRTLLPFDHPTLEASVRKTGRLIIFDDSNRTCGFAAEVSADVAEKLFSYLKAPIVRITRADVPVPFSAALDKEVMPSGASLERAVRMLLSAQASSAVARG
jgi:pyruvate dehydrogenase E1 component beta subunit